MKDDQRIILASSSPYRRQQLSQLGMSFECVSPDLDETPLPGEPPQQLAARLAAAKAAKVLKTHPNAVVIGSDQVAELHGQILGKPLTVSKAIQQLSACSNNSVTFFTGACVANAKQSLNSMESTKVKFRPLSTAEIHNYINREPALDCAGSFKCEGLGIALFESIQSSDPSALIGLPLISVAQMLARLGLSVLD